MANDSAKIGAAYVEITADTTGLKAGMSEAEVTVKRAEGSIKGLQKALGAVTRIAGLAGASIAAAFGIAKTIDSFTNSTDAAREKLDAIGASAREFSKSIAAAFGKGPKTEVQKQVKAIFDGAAAAAESASREASGQLKEDVLLRALGLSSLSRDEIVKAAYEAGNQVAQAAAAGAARAKDADKKAQIDKAAKEVRDAIKAQQEEISKGEFSLLPPIEQTKKQYAETVRELFNQLRAASDPELKRLLVDRINLEGRLRDVEIQKQAADEAERQAAAASKVAAESERSAKAAIDFADSVARARIESVQFQDRQQAGFGLGDIQGSLEDLKTAVRSLSGQIR